MHFMLPETQSVLTEVLADLPQIGSGGDGQEQIRAVLRPLIERAIVAGPNAPPIPDPDHLGCPNCGSPTDSVKSPYCSDRCRLMSAFIRQFRASLADQSILQPERQAGMGQAFWSFLGGGYPHRQQMVPKRVVMRVIERDGGLCTLCGAPATEIDHTGSG
jgi:hypothetical protein